jgi:hypothetical protein
VPHIIRRTCALTITGVMLGLPLAAEAVCPDEVCVELAHHLATINLRPVLPDVMPGEVASQWSLATLASGAGDSVITASAV